MDRTGEGGTDAGYGGDGVGAGSEVCKGAEVFEGVAFFCEGVGVTGADADDSDGGAGDF